jgi:hypothetical protein
MIIHNLQVNHAANGAKSRRILRWLIVKILQMQQRTQNAKLLWRRHRPNAFSCVVMQQLRDARPGPPAGATIWNLEL